jgi:hypothetical protein
VEPGDHFIHYSRSGSTQDIVKEVRTKISYDLSNQVKVMKSVILGVSGKTYDQRECLPIVGQISCKFLKLLNRFFNKN